MDPDPDPDLVFTDLDPGGQNIHESGTATLVLYTVRDNTLEYL
jgi:hypothetical protein